MNREPVNGQSYLYLGRNDYLQYRSDVEMLELKGRYFFTPEGTVDKLNSLFKEFYKSKTKKNLPVRIAKYGSMLGLQIEEISVMELKSRWASCSSKKPKINFHWKVMMAPTSVIDYLIVHELTHFKHKRHNADFWNAVDKIMLDYQKQAAWLKQYGASLAI